jgi:hypothetical protein
MIKIPAVLYKILVIGIILLFIGALIAPTISSDTASSTTLDNDGSLLGYVNDTSGNPIVKALVRVYFHGTYEEDYSDSVGFYHVTNIPICYCLKNATCSKECYKTEWALLSIAENTTYDFMLTSVNCPPTRPIVWGPTRVPPGTYEYTFKATDPNGDDIKYFIDWGDGNKEVTDFYPSGQEIELSHTFLKISYYLVSATAVDIHEMQSEVGMIPVRISQSRQLTNLIISQFLEQFPFLEVFLRAMNLLR